MEAKFDYQNVYEYMIDDTLPRVQAAVIACIRSYEGPTEIKFQDPGNEDIKLPVEFWHKHWGCAGGVELAELSPSQTSLQFLQPPSPELIEVLAMETSLRQTVPEPAAGIRLWSVQGRRDKILEILQGHLHRHRLSAHQDAHDWLCKKLRIYGYHCNGNLTNASQIHEDFWSRSAHWSTRKAFSFLIQGTAAKFAGLVMGWENHPTYGTSITAEITDPDSELPLRYITPDLNSVRIVLRSSLATLYIFATSLSNDQAELRVDLLDEEDNWKLWDRLRDKMEEHGQFSLESVKQGVDKVNTRLTPVKHNPGLHNEHFDSRNGNQENSMNISPKVLEKEPDLAIGGKHQLILQMWRDGYSAREIGLRTNRTAKTILNRLSSLRKEYGDGIVPRRRLG